MMAATWRHDRRWLGAWLGILTALWAMGWKGEGDETWIPGLEGPFETRRLLVFVAALALGVWVAARDRVVGVREHWIHRDVAAGRLFAWRIVACGVLVVLALSLVYTASWFGWLDDPWTSREIWTAERLPHQAILLALAWPGLAAGCLIGTLGGPVWRAALEAVLVACAVSWLATYGATNSLFVLETGGGVSPWIYLAWQSLLGWPLLLIAQGRQERGADADHGRAERRPALAAATLAACAALLGQLGLESANDQCAGSLRFNHFPVVSLEEDGSVRRVRRLHGMDRIEDGVLVDEEHRPLRDAPVAATRRTSSWEGDGSRILPPRAQMHGLGVGWRNTATDLADADMPFLRTTWPRRNGWPSRDGMGVVRKSREAPWEGVYMPRRTHKLRHRLDTAALRAHRWPWTRADGRPLSHEAEWIFNRFDERPRFLDATDGTLWQAIVHGRPGHALEAMPLPPGGPVGEHAAGLSRNARGKFESILYVRTQAGWFGLRGETWHPEAVLRNAHVRFEWRAVPLGVQRVDEVLGPLDVLSRVVGENGEVLLEHRYRPKTAVEHRLASAMGFLTALQAPALNAAAHFGTLRSVAPFVANGHHRAVLAASIAASILFAAWVARRLRRLNVAPRVARAWIVGTALGGPSVLLAQWVFVRPRAWAGMGVVGSPPPLLVPRHPRKGSKSD